MADNENKIQEADKAASKASDAKAKADEKVKADAEAKASEVELATEGLVKMAKDGEVLFVHPTTVESHKSVGWQFA